MSRNDSGWIKDYRSLLNWRWFKDPNTAHLWHYLLLRASWLDEEQEFRTIKIKKKFISIIKRERYVIL